MPDHRQAQTSSSSGPATVPPTSVDPAAQQTYAQQTYGNAAEAASLTDGSLAGRMPGAAELKELGLNVTLPGGRTLVGGWNQVETSGGTTIFLRMTARTLSISFSPPLTVDVQWPVSNVEWYGVEYDFLSGSVTKVDVRNSQTFALPGASGSVDARVREFVASTVAGTPLARSGYNPMVDPDPQGTLAALQRNATAGGGASGGGVGAGDVSRVTPMATIATRSEIAHGTDAGGIRIPGGTSISLAAELAGTGAELQDRGLQGVTRVSLSTQGIELTSKGQPIAKLQELQLLHGGRVQVDRFEALGALREAQQTESGIRALAHLLQMAMVRNGRDPGPLVTSLEPGVVNAVATNELERALTSAIRGLIGENATAIPGADLRSVLGVR